MKLWYKLHCLRIGALRSCLIRSGPRRGRQRKVWSRIVDEFFKSLGIDNSVQLRQLQTTLNYMLGLGAVHTM